jgi:tetratricopeptide (TPR) repeat protein
MLKKSLSILFFTIAVFAQQNSYDQNQFMLAQSYEQRGDFDKAVEIVETLNKKDPSNIIYFNKLNALYLQLKKYDESVNLINSRIKLTPNDINLYGMLGETYYTAGDQNRANNIWDTAGEKFKDNPMTFRILANFAVEKRDFEKAIELLNKGKKYNNDPYLFSYQLGELYNITMRYREAAEEYCSLMKSNPSQYQQIENRILSYSNKPNALDETIEVVKKYESGNISFEYLLARLYIEKKNYDEAFNLYKEIDKRQNSSGSDLYSFAELIFRDGEYSTAFEVFKYLIDNYPNQKNTQLVKLGFAKTQESILMQKYNALYPDWEPFSNPPRIKQEEIEPVIKAYQGLIKDYQNSEVAVEANLRIGILLFHLQDDLAGAEKYLRTITDTYPASKFASLALIELGSISQIQGNLNEAEKYYQSINKLVRPNTEDKSYANYQLSRVYAFKNDFKTSKSILATVLGNLRDNIANDAIEFSVILNTAKNDSSNLSIYCNAEYLAEQRKFEEAQNLYQQLSDNPQAFIFHSIAKLRVAEMLIAEDNYDKAISNLGLIVEEGEKNIYADKALYLKGQIYYYGLNDSAKAIECYESLLIKFPKSLYLDEARQHIIELKNKIS